MIEIRQPELEQRVREQIQSGRFHDVDELLTKALDALREKETLSMGQTGARKPTAARKKDLAQECAAKTGAALIAAMQASPYRDIELEPERYPMPVRDVHL